MLAGEFSQGDRFVQSGRQLNEKETYRASFGSDLYPDLDHVNGLDDAGSSHTTETTVEERLCGLPGRAQVFPLEVRHLHATGISTSSLCS